MNRGRTRIGERAQRRLLAGGPRATGRPAASRAEWERIRDTVLARARWACQACGARSGLEVHHVLKRSQGGSDFDLDGLVALCRTCHAQTDAPYATGRLVLTPLGAGQVACEVVHRASKWDTTELGVSGSPPAISMPLSTGRVAEVSREGRTGSRRPAGLW